VANKTSKETQPIGNDKRQFGVNLLTSFQYNARLNIKAKRQKNYDLIFLSIMQNQLRKYKTKSHALGKIEDKIEWDCLLTGFERIEEIAILDVEE